MMGFLVPEIESYCEALSLRFCYRRDGYCREGLGRCFPANLASWLPLYFPLPLRGSALPSLDADSCLVGSLRPIDWFEILTTLVDDSVRWRFALF